MSGTEVALIRLATTVIGTVARSLLPRRPGAGLVPDPVRPALPDLSLLTGLSALRILVLNHCWLAEGLAPLRELPAPARGGVEPALTPPQPPAAPPPRTSPPWPPLPRPCSAAPRAVRVPRPGGRSTSR